jgi:ribulose 1,5-bisphosphate carboxylase large subunit-like protein
MICDVQSLKVFNISYLQAFYRYVGIDHSRVNTRISSLEGLRVYVQQQEKDERIAQLERPVRAGVTNIEQPSTQR